MAYRKDSQRILATSIHLGEPVDKVDSPGALILQNWRSDVQRRLVSRPGCQEVPGSPVAGDIHSILVRRGNPNRNRYFGSADDLYRDGTSIASGFDGAPIFGASMNDRIWFMNRGKSGKDDGTNFRPWLPDAPTTAPTAATIARVSKTIADFGSGWQFYLNGVLTTDTDVLRHETLSGRTVMTLFFGTDGGETQAAFSLASPPVDLGLEGQQRSEDVVSIAINCSQPQRVERIDLYVGVGFLDGIDNYYRVSIPGSKLSAEPDSWGQVEILRGRPAELPIDDPPLYFERIGNSTGASWATAANVFINVVATGETIVRFDDWLVYGGTSGALDGSYQYAVTFETDEGEETNAGPFSAALTVAKQPVNLSSVPVAAGGQGVNKRHIYRVGGQQAAALRIGTINDNTTTVFEDRVSESDAQALGAEMPLFNQAPPLCRGVVQAGQRLVLWAPADGKNRILWTELNRPQHVGEDSYEPVGDDDEEVVKVTHNGRSHVIWKERSIWRLDGDPLDGVLHKALSIGLVGPRAESDGFFISDDGFYFFNLDGAQLLSEKVWPIFRGVPVVLGSITIQAMSTAASDRARCVVQRVGDRVYLFYPTGAGGPTAGLVYSITTGGWSSWASEQGIPQAMCWEGTGGELLAGFTGGAVRSLELAGDDDGEPITIRYQSPYLDQGLPSNAKVYADLEIKHRLRGASLSVFVELNDGATQQTVGTITSTTAIVTSIFPLGPDGAAVQEAAGVEANNISVRIEGEVSSVLAAEILDIHVRYYVQARAARSFDTGAIDLGTADAKEVKAARLELENGAQVDVRLSSELGAVAGLVTAQDRSAAAGARRSETISFTNTIEGHLIRLVAGSTQTFRLWALWLLLRRLPNVVPPAWTESGYVWKSNPIRLPNVCRARRLEMEIFTTDGAVDVALRSDGIPAGDVADRYTFQVNTGVVGRRVKVVTIPNETAGRLFELQLRGTNGYRLERARLEVRDEAGVYFPEGEGAYDSTWLDLGDPRWKNIQQFQIELANPTHQVALTISYQGGSGSITPTSQTIPTGQRRRLVFNLAKDARRVRVQLACDGALSIFDAHFLARVWGHYLEAGQVYKPEPRDVGDGARALFQELEIHGQADSAVTVRWYTDQPGSGLALRETWTINPTSRHGLKQRIPNYVRGRVYGIEIESAGAVRLFAVRVRAKVLGQAGETSWAWVDFPVEPTPPLPSIVPLGIQPEDRDWRWVDFPVQGAPNEYEWVQVPVDAVE